MKGPDDEGDLFSWEHTHSHASDPHTSPKAARKARRVAEAQERLVFLYIWFHPRVEQDRLRDEVLNPKTGKPLGDNAAKRCSDLHRKGWIKDSGEKGYSHKGNGAVRWEVTPFGIEEYTKRYGRVEVEM